MHFPSSLRSASWRTSTLIGSTSHFMFLSLFWGSLIHEGQVRLRARLAETEQTIPDQVHKPTARPTMRWVFQCFEGIELLHVQTSTASLTIVLRLRPLHRLILALLAPLSE